MKTHEQHTITGELEITDSKTMKVLARKLTLTAERTTSLQGRAYAHGRKIECIFPANTDLSTGQGTGPWGPGGYGGYWLKHNATEIKALERVRAVKTRQAGENIGPKDKPHKPHKKSTKQDIHVFVEGELKARVIQAAKEQGLDMGQIVTEALEMWFKKPLPKRH